MSNEVADSVVLARDVHKTYGAGEVQAHVLRGVSLDVRRGEMVAIMGPGGGGKTTLLNCLSGLDDIDSGIISIAGSELGKMSDAEKTRFRATRMATFSSPSTCCPCSRHWRTWRCRCWSPAFPKRSPGRRRRKPWRFSGSRAATGTIPRSCQEDSSSVFTIGDSVTYSIKNTAASSLRSVDETLVVDEDSEIWEGRALPDSFPESVFQEIAPALDADPDVDGALPALTEDVAVISPDSQQFESSALLAGLDPQRAMVFDELFDTEGAPLDFSVLRPGEVYITRSGAEALQVEAGSALSVALGPGMLTPINVRGVVDGSYVSAEGVDVVLMAALSSVQELLGRPGALSAILISNRGDVFGGIGLTDTSAIKTIPSSQSFFPLGVSADSTSCGLSETCRNRKWKTPDADRCCAPP